MRSNALLFGSGLLETLFLSGSRSNFDLGFKIATSIIGILGLVVVLYVVFLKRWWKKDEEHEKEKEENRKLEFKNEMAAMKGELLAEIQGISQKVSSLEGTLNGLADIKSFHALKYSLENDVDELQKDVKNFAAQGSLPDLKARVDEVAQKVDRLEDFRHKSADRYVLMTNYQQDTRMITDAISALREDLRAMIDMVDKL